MSGSQGAWVDTGFRKLLMRRGRLYLRKRVPADVTHRWGGPKVIERSLGTSDMRQAERQARIVVGQLEAQWETIRGTGDDEGGTPETPADVAPQGFPVTRRNVQAQAPKKPQRPHFRLSGLADAYLRQLMVDGSGRSHLDACRRALGELKTAVDDRPIVTISRDEAHRHINRLRGTLRVNTVRTRAKILSGFFNWVRHERGLIETNVFQGLRIRGEVDEPRRPWTPEEIGRVRTLMADTPPALNLLQLLYMTGMRRSEAAQLRHSDIETVQVDGESRQFIHVRESKTRAGIRTIPVHRELAPLVEAMMHDASDDNAFLLDCGGDYKGRETNIVAKIRVAMRGEGLTYRGLVLHGLRNTFATLLEQAGVSEDVSADIMGHKRTTITYGLYSGGTSINQRFEATDRLKFTTK